MTETWMERATRLLREAHASAESQDAESALMLVDVAREALVAELDGLVLENTDKGTGS